MIHSGIDWSGSPDHDSSVFYAMVHLAGHHVPELEAALRAANTRLHVPEWHRRSNASSAASTMRVVREESRLLTVPIPRRQIRGHEEIMAIVRLIIVQTMWSAGRGST
ncbi:MAG: hypothetical protein U0Z70_12460 [Thermomicrobiales bacterium]